MSLRLEVVSVEEKTSKKGNKFWRTKCSDGKYYNSMKYITAAVYDMKIEGDFIKEFQKVEGETKKEPQREQIPQMTPTVNKDRSFAVSYAKDVLISQMSELYPSKIGCTVQHIMDTWTILTAHAIWLLSQPEENIEAAAQAIEESEKENPKEETVTEPF